MTNKAYVQKLEAIIRQMLVPLKNIPFNLVIEEISGHKVIPFNRSSNQDRCLLKNLKKVAVIAGEEINLRGIKRTRPNEVGNDIEIFVKNTLKQVGYTAEIPSTAKGKKSQLVTQILNLLMSLAE